MCPSLCPSVRSKGHYGSNSLRISAINLKFGGMMHSTGWWSRLQFKMAILGQFLHISWNFEIFHDRLRPGLRDDITTNSFNTLRPGQNGRHFPDDHLKCIFLNENIWISINISLKFVPKGRSNNIPALVLIMAWHRLGDKPLSKPVLVGLLTHICVTWPQWVKDFSYWPEIWWDNAQYHEADCF